MSSKASEVLELLEMSNTVSLESGYTISGKTLKKLIKQCKSVEEFLKKVEARTKLTTSDRRRLTGAYNEELK